MNVLVSGSSGLVGTSLVPRLREAGDEVRCLVRRPIEREGEIRWSPEEHSIQGARLEGFSGVVHLAGESIADGRWSDAKMRRIRDSRVEGTRLLAESLASLAHKPSVLVCASAIGFYGDRGQQVVDEQARPGSGFLADVCRDWEDACDPARQAGIRVVNLRFGVVLSPRGGALGKMLLPFRLGLGGKIGSGKQWMSWIEVDDAVAAISHALRTPTLSGPVNTVSPSPVTNAEYTKTLGRVLSRPTLFSMPAIGARLAFGKMADELLLASIRAEPRALLAMGFEFSHPQLEGALRHALGSSAVRRGPGHELELREEKV